MPGIALALAGLGALGYGVASVLQALAARGGGGTFRTIGQPAYVAGTVLDLLAWLCSLAALRTLPVFEVQGVLACSLAVTAVAARVVLGDRLGRPGVLAVGLSALALVALAASAGPGHPVSLDTAQRAWLALGVVPIVAVGWPAARARRSAACAALAGLAFGGAALCARAVTLPSHPLDDFAFDDFAFKNFAPAVRELAADPLVWALAGFGITGMLLYANALEHGDPAVATALLWLAEVAVPSVIGIALLGDSVRPGRGVVAFGAIFLCLSAAWLLTRTPREPPTGGRGLPVARAATEQTEVPR